MWKDLSFVDHLGWSSGDNISMALELSRSGTPAKTILKTVTRKSATWNSASFDGIDDISSS